MNKSFGFFSNIQISQEYTSGNLQLKAPLLLRRAYTMKYFFHDLETFISNKKCRNISGSEMCVTKYYSICSQIKCHSYDHDNVSFIEKIHNLHFSCDRYYSFKSCLKILKKRSQLCC